MNSRPIHPNPTVTLVAVMLPLLLLCIFVGSVAQGADERSVNLASGAMYWLSQPPEDRYPDSGSELTDGIKGQAHDLFSGAWQGHRREDFRVITVDLGAPRRIHEVGIGLLNDLNAGITLPSMLQLSTSVTGSDWTDPIILLSSRLGPIDSPERKEVAFSGLDTVARYVRITLYVDVWLFIDEIEVWGEERPVEGISHEGELDLSDPLLGVAAASAGTAPSEVAPQPSRDKVANGYLPAGSQEAAGIKHLMLIYTHMDWTPVDALPYVAYSKRDPRRPYAPAEWEDWFFDSFLFLSQITPNGQRAFQHAERAAPARWEDWIWFLDYLFREDQQLGAFNRAVAEAKRFIDDPEYRAKVVIMIPYPILTQTDFGDPFGTGRSLSFAGFPQGAEAQRAARFGAVKAYLEELFRRIDAAEYEHLEFAGLYWMSELIDGSADMELIQAVAHEVQQRELKFLWIPYFNARGWDQWKEAGFDAAILQPNYMFDSRVAISRFQNVADLAQRYGMGVEIEADGTVLTSEGGRQRYLAYLRAGRQYGFMDQALHGYFQSVNVLLQAFSSRNEEVRELYDLTYQYVKGTYDPSS